MAVVDLAGRTRGRRKRLDSACALGLEDLTNWTRSQMVACRVGGDRLIGNIKRLSQALERAWPAPHWIVKVIPTGVLAPPIVSCKGTAAPRGASMGVITLICWRPVVDPGA